MGEVERIAKGLTKAQRAMLVESEPGAFGRDDDGTGAEVYGAGKWAVARALVGMGFGDIEEHPGYWPPALYFSNSTGLAVRDYLKDHTNGK